MHINRERTDTSADDLGDLDLAAEREYRDFPVTINWCSS
jgi:spermine oxidase